MKYRSTSEITGSSCWAYPLLRVTAGLMLLPHVWPKFVSFGAAGFATSLARRGIEPALPFAYLVMFTELAGGICIANRIFGTTFRSALLDRNDCNCNQGACAKWLGVQCAGRRCRISSDVAILFLVILIRGGGHFSVDRAIGKEV